MKNVQKQTNKYMQFLCTKPSYNLGGIMLLRISMFIIIILFLLSCGKKEDSILKTIKKTPPSDYILVHGGTFQMGGKFGGFEERIHRDSVNTFAICNHEVTRVEWLKVMGDNKLDSLKSPNCPVEKVSWYDVVKFCNLKSTAEGLTPVYSIKGTTNPTEWGEVPTSYSTIWSSVICEWSANGYRMPKESEWRYAASGGNKSLGNYYSGSNDINEVAWFDDNSGLQSHNVMTKKPNELGLYDMSGNVWEWCWDWIVNKNCGPDGGNVYVFKEGGNYGCNAEGCKGGIICYMNPFYHEYYFGIRLCRTIQ
jgi:formylglycine-generating enzyme required for sulfatase activity